jgi:hypothetical protein
VAFFDVQSAFTNDVSVVQYHYFLHNNVISRRPQNLVTSLRGSGSVAGMKRSIILPALAVWLQSSSIIVRGFAPLSPSGAAISRSARRARAQLLAPLRAQEGDAAATEEVVGADDLLNSPAFLKKKIELLEKQLEQTGKDIEAANAEADEVGGWVGTRCWLSLSSSDPFPFVIAGMGRVGRSDGTPKLGVRLCEAKNAERYNGGCWGGEAQVAEGHLACE